MSNISDQVDAGTVDLSQLLTLIEMKTKVQVKMAEDKKTLQEENTKLKFEMDALISAATLDEKEIVESIIQLKAIIEAIKAIVNAPISNPVDV